MPMPLDTRTLHPGTNLADFGDWLFGGGLWRFPGAIGAQGKLLNELVKEVEQAFAPHPLTQAHLHFSNLAFIDKIEAAQAGVTALSEQLVKAIVENLGWLKDDCYWDRLVLRIVPPLGHYAITNRNQHTPVHRDTWGVNLYSQCNWWLSLTGLDANTCMRFYPDYWTRPIANSCDSWSYQDYARALMATPAGSKADYPSVPVALTSPDNPSLMLIDPMEWMVFSAAHLHDTAPNQGDTTRFSLEFRSIHLKHLEQGRSAPNLDNPAAGHLCGLFRRLSDNARLTRDLLACATTPGV